MFNSFGINKLMLILIILALISISLGIFYYNNNNDNYFTMNAIIPFIHTDYVPENISVNEIKFYK